MIIARWLLAIFVLAMFAGSALAAENFYSGLRAYKTGNFPRALEIWQPLADAGNAGAQAHVALYHFYGIGGHKFDPAMGVLWAQKAADQGDAMAQGLLGSAYGTGAGVKQDYALAIRWLLRSAEQGHLLGLTLMGDFQAAGLGLAKDPVTAYMWYDLAGRFGSAGAFGRSALAAKLKPAERSRAKALADAWVKSRRFRN